MLITREVDYALRILRALGDGALRSIEEISKMEAAPKQFAYKIIKKLEKADWIQILRGAEGGCRLTADLSTVSLYDLVQTMGTDSIVSACLEPGYRCSRREVCDGKCLVQGGLYKVQDAITAELKRYTLKELIGGAEDA